MHASFIKTIDRLRRDAIDAELPSLRRHAEAMSDNRASADVYVAAVTDILSTDLSALPAASSAKVGLFKLYTRLYAHLFNAEQRAEARARQVLLLVMMEGFSNGEAAEILDLSMAQVIAILKSAGCTTPELNRTRAAGNRGAVRRVVRSVRVSPPANAGDYASNPTITRRGGATASLSVPRSGT
ncbi:hypothetical protein [Niveispirillum sp.]|uniref:hypothetical protein n=1 Tax=Niveispirillum sp. TaxID=1917217 RepID=UPI001B765581|nr:hypothetical protein [Niveispirillum sp.]MBP7337476.1 hypothetical protein [Niveispirillum sp.]